MPNNLSNKHALTVVTVISLMPFLFFSYNFFPDAEYYEILGFNFDFTINGTLNSMAWSFANKFLFIGILSVWYITEGRNWYRLILILMVYQIYLTVSNTVLISQKNNFLDANWFNIVLITAVISSLWFVVLEKLRRKLNYDTDRSISVLSQIEKELGLKIKSSSKFKVKNYKKFKKDFGQLKLNKSKMTKKDYLKALIVIKDNYKKDGKN